MMKFAAKSMLYHILRMWKAKPRLLADSEVSGFDCFQRRTPAIFAVFVSSPTATMNYIIHSLLVSGIIRHVVPFTIVQINSLVGVQEVIVVWQEPCGKIGEPSDRLMKNPLQIE
jgi:hypothetical protein